MEVDVSQSKKELASGIDLLVELNKNLVQEMNADFGTIALIPSGDQSRLETVVYHRRDQLLDNLIYKTEGTPCEIVLNNRVCAIESDAYVKFSEDILFRDEQIEAYVGCPITSIQTGRVIGVYTLLFKSPRKNLGYIVNKLNILIPRVEVELDRLYLKDRMGELLTLFNSIVNQSSEGVVIMDHDGKFISVNKAFCDLTGYSEDELLKIYYKDLITEHSSEKRRIVSVNKKDGKEVSLEIVEDHIQIEGKEFVLGMFR